VEISSAVTNPTVGEVITYKPEWAGLNVVLSGTVYLHRRCGVRKRVCLRWVLWYVNVWVCSCVVRVCLWLCVRKRRCHLLEWVSVVWEVLLTYVSAVWLLDENWIYTVLTLVQSKIPALPSAVQTVWNTPNWCDNISLDCSKLGVWNTPKLTVAVSISLTSYSATRKVVEDTHEITNKTHYGKCIAG
jgi:hypothetical protein